MCIYVGDCHSNYIGDLTVLSMCVVPARICHEKSNKEVISFGICQYIDEGPWHRRNKNIYINIKTLNGQERQSTHITDGIKVCKLTPEADEHQKWIKLPSSYINEEIPVDRSEIATPAKLKQWQYLEKLSNFLGGNDNISVDLLNGANCVEALLPLEVIPSQQDGPYACMTILQWYVNGPIVDEKPDAVSCNQIAVLQAENGSIAKYHFQVQNKCEDIGIKEILRKI